MREAIVYPDMRFQVKSSLESMSDPALQERWGKYEEGVNYYDDLDLNVHILYDDMCVLPDPADSVPAVLYAEEIQVFEELNRVFDPLLEDAALETDDDFLADPRWPDVMRAAKHALDVMRQRDER